VSIALYLDVHVPIAIANALSLRGVDVLTAQEDGAGELSDPELLDRATTLGRVLFTQDKDFLSETYRRQETGETFGGVIYVHQLHITIGQSVAELELIAKVCAPADFINHIEYLPL
jgi:hypothetical protein